MSWDNLNPILVYTVIGAVIFFTIFALFAKGGVDDDDSNNHSKSH